MSEQGHAMTPQTIADERAEATTHQLHLLYHELRPDAAAYSYVTDTDLFREQMHVCGDLLKSKANVIPVITFDDGHTSNYTLAAPILEDFGIKAHFFITAGWTATRTGFMDWAQLRALVAAGHRIGAHGWSHRLLPHCNHAELQDELVRPLKMLEDALGILIDTISLPGGRANRRVFAACEEAGYACVYTSVPRPEPVFATATTRRTIGRVNIHGGMTPSSLAQLLVPGSPSLRRLGQVSRAKAAAQSLLGDRLYARLWSIVNHEEADSTSTAASSFPDGTAS
jgi:hypothetical protein